jgi:hypothetical protein
MVFTEIAAGAAKAGEAVAKAAIEAGKVVAEGARAVGTEVARAGAEVVKTGAGAVKAGVEAGAETVKDVAETGKGGIDSLKGAASDVVAKGSKAAEKAGNGLGEAAGSGGHLAGQAGEKVQAAGRGAGEIGAGLGETASPARMEAADLQKKAAESIEKPAPSKGDPGTAGEPYTRKTYALNQELKENLDAQRARTKASGVEHAARYGENTDGKLVPRPGSETHGSHSEVSLAPRNAGDVAASHTHPEGHVQSSADESGFLEEKNKVEIIDGLQKDRDSGKVNVIQRTEATSPPPPASELNRFKSEREEFYRQNRPGLDGRDRERLVAMDVADKYHYEYYYGDSGHEQLNLQNMDHEAYARHIQEKINQQSKKKPDS